MCACAFAKVFLCVKIRCSHDWQMAKLSSACSIGNCFHNSAYAFFYVETAREHSALRDGLGDVACAMLFFCLVPSQWILELCGKLATTSQHRVLAHTSSGEKIRTVCLLPHHTREENLATTSPHHTWSLHPCPLRPRLATPVSRPAATFCSKSYAHFSNAHVSLVRRHARLFSTNADADNMRELSKTSSVTRH